MQLSPLLTPAGNDTEVQYNDSQLFAGDSTFTFNKTTKLLSAQDLTLSNDLIAVDATLSGTLTAIRLLIGS